jgi:hypothetical protein
VLSIEWRLGAELNRKKKESNVNREAEPTTFGTG